MIITDIIRFYYIFIRTIKSSPRYIFRNYLYFLSDFVLIANIFLLVFLLKAYLENENLQYLASLQGFFKNWQLKLSELFDIHFLLLMLYTYLLHQICKPLVAFFVIAQQIDN